MVGDFDQSNLLAAMTGECDSPQCHDPQPLQFSEIRLFGTAAPPMATATATEHLKFNWTHSGGIPAVSTAEVEMTAYKWANDMTINENASIERDLLKAINAAVLKTSQCTQVESVFYHDPIRRREIDPPPPDTEWFAMCVEQDSMV